MPGTKRQPSVTVVICAYTELRWRLLLAAIASVRAQTLTPQELIVVVDHNPSLHRRLRAQVEPQDAVKIVENSGPHGLSGARNTGVYAATGDVVAFLDDDAAAAPDWLERLCALYDDQDVIAVGGRIVPRWETGRPRYFAEELDWIVGCTYRGMPEVAAAVRNMIGANMSFRREVFERVGGFDTSMGRVDTLPLGCEETEICIRASIEIPRARIVYEPTAVVWHHVPQERTSFRYMLSRSWSEGISKARVSRLVGQRQALGAERHYARIVLPRAFIAGLRNWRNDIDGSGWRRSVTLLAVLAATTLGYARGRLFIKPIRLSALGSSIPRESEGGTNVSTT